MHSTELAVISQAKVIPVTARPHPLTPETVYAEFPYGQSIAEILGPNARCCRVELGGVPVPQVWWPHVRPKMGVALVIIRYPEGGASAKSIFRLIAFAALAAAAIVISGGSLAALSFIPGNLFGAGTISAGLLAAGVGLVGTLIINALIPPPSAPSLGASTNLLRSITGTSNKANLYGPIPFAIGTILCYPTLAALPVTELSGDDQYLRMLFDLGYGTPAVSDMKIANTDLTTYTNVETELGVSPGLFSQDIAEVAVGLELDLDASPGVSIATGDLLSAVEAEVRAEAEAADHTSTQFSVGTSTSGLSADELSIDLQWAQGLFGVDSNGNTTTTTCVVRIDFRLTGTTTWTGLDSTSGPGLTISNTAATSIGGGIFNVVNGERKAVRLGLRWKVTRGQYDVRVTRSTTDYGSAGADSEIGALTWTLLRTIRYTSVSTTGTLKLAVRILATDQLSGSINQFNCILAQPIPVWHPDTSEWIDEISDNCAFVYRWLMKDCPANPRLVDVSRIDDDTLKEWALECTAGELGYNNMVDSSTTLFAILKDVCAAGRASFNIREGLYSVVRDVAQTTPIQVFTPRNSFGFSGTRAFTDAVDALRVQFVNPEAGYQQDEVVVYDDGFGSAAMVIADPSLTLAVNFEQLTIAGCTNANAAWRLGRYHLAAGRLRPNTYTLNADIENLVCNRGDLVLVANDVISVGLAWGRITSTTVDTGTGQITEFTCDERLTAETGISYAVRVRCNDGTVVLSAVTLPRFGDGIQSVTLTTPGAGIKEGDLFVFGVVGQDAIPMIVTKIEPGADLSAKISTVDSAPAVLTADSGTPPVFTSNITGQPWVDAPPPPDLLIIGSDQILGYPDDAGISTPAMSVTVSGTWSGPHALSGTGSYPAVDHIDVRVRLTSTVGTWTTYTLPQGQNTIVIDGLIRGVNYQVEARTVSAQGGASAWVQQTHTIADANQIPLAPVGLSALSVADGVALTWGVSGTQRSDVQYEIERTGDISGSPDSAGWTQIATISGTAYTDGITDRVTRWYRVRAIDYQQLATGWDGPVQSYNKAMDDGSAVLTVSSGITYASSTYSAPGPGGASIDKARIDISWTLNGYLTNKVRTPISDTGTFAALDLSFVTDYNFYPYWDLAAGHVAFVTTGGFAGGPAHIGVDFAWTAEQNSQGHVPLSEGPVTCTTLADGSSGGGSGGGSGGCLRRDMLVLEKTRGVVAAGSVRKGEWLRYRLGWLKVLEEPALRLHDSWVSLSFANGVEELVTTSSHPFEHAETGTAVRAHDLTLETPLRCPTGITYPTIIELMRGKEYKVAIKLESPHVFWASTDGENWVETHNLRIPTDPAS